jgi:hypothetical protein
MPRQIIDTESSRPAYRRRLTIRWIAIALILVAAAILGIVAWRASHPPLQGKAAARVNLDLLSSTLGDLDAA